MHVVYFWQWVFLNVTTVSEIDGSRYLARKIQASSKRHFTISTRSNKWFLRACFRSFYYVAPVYFVPREGIEARSGHLSLRGERLLSRYKTNFPNVFSHFSTHRVLHIAEKYFSVSYVLSVVSMLTAGLL